MHVPLVRWVLWLESTAMLYCLWFLAFEKVLTQDGSLEWSLRNLSFLHLFVGRKEEQSV